MIDNQKIYRSLPVFFKQHNKALVFLLIFAVCMLLFGSNLNGFWRSDDTAILYHMLQYSVPEYFFSPQAWRELSTANLTPWLSLSFAIDYGLAGLAPSFFYAHQLIVISITAWLLFVLLSRKFHVGFALLGALLFLSGTPTARVASQLMTRHYAEGLLFSLLAYLFYLHWQTQQKSRHLVICLFFYAMAMTAKEIYVPLGVLFLLLLKGSPSEKLSQGWSFVILMLLYIFWRSFMLNTVVGGYTENPQYLTVSYWQTAAATFLSFPRILLGSNWQIITAISAAPLLFSVFFYRKNIFMILLLSALVLIPLMPLIIFPGINNADRYLYLPWFFLAVALSVFSAQLHLLLHEKVPLKILAPASTGLALILLGFPLYNSFESNRARTIRLAESDEQVRFIWENDNSVSFFPVGSISSTYWLIRSAGRIMALENPGRTIPVTITDERFLSEDRPLFEYSRDCQCMVDISSSIAERVREFQAMLRPNEALELSILNEQGTLTWSFGPRRPGRYRLVTNTRGSLNAPREGAVRTGVNEDTEFYLRFTSSEGWITYSPLLTIKADGTPTVWTRE
jgi:hypothetical protein